MSKLLEGKLALILGIANKWSLAYAIAQAFSREGATLVLSYLGERQKESIEELSKGLNVAAVLPCDVTKNEELAALTESLAGLGRPPPPPSGGGPATRSRARLRPRAPPRTPGTGRRG